MLLHRHTLHTPLGPMRAVASDAALCALEFQRGERLTRLERRLARYFGETSWSEQPNAIVERTEALLDRYFEGSSADFGELPLDLRGAPFELRVWAALRRIPCGATASYGQIARELGDPGASRAVGMANGANPIAIIVPCHRVIGASGALTGYGGGLDKKVWLLDHERRWRADSLFTSYEVPALLKKSRS
jgi:O-6-methylguanine DNA methyltransferase